MPNHPNRNWRRAANAAADLHLALLKLPADGAALLTTAEVAQLIRDGVIAGFDAGRQSRAKAFE